MAKVSVIIPLYNKGYLVVRAINSILAQTFQDFEIVVVDDGSTDDGPGCVREFTDPRLRMVRQENAGPGAARNRGVRESSPALVAFLDADDEFAPDFLSVSVRNLDANPDCVLSVANHYRGTDKIPATLIPPCDIGIRPGPWRLSPDADARETWGSLIYMQTWVVVCRKEIFILFGGAYEHHCTYAEDQYVWLQILLNCRMYRDTTPLIWYHTEDSELYGPNRRSDYPMLPILSDPGPVRKSCPDEYRHALDKLIAFIAAADFFTFSWQVDLPAMQFLIREYPELKTWRKDWMILFLKAGIKRLIRSLIVPAQTLKRRTPRRSGS